MSGETVVYRNEMNLVPLRKFTSTEVDLFFTLCNKLKEQDTRKLEIPFDELKHLSNYYSRSQERFIKDLEHVYDKMLHLTYTERNGQSFEKFVLFTSYKVDVEKQYLSISINNDLKHILNSITADFTKFELQEMTQLKSTYAKNMFRLLKQYKHTGYFKIQIYDFRERLDIPKSYRMSEIDKYVFKPIIKELGFLFKKLNINKIKAKKGRKIEWLEFSFEPEKRIHSKREPNMVRGNNSKQHMSREMTPEWLKNNKYQTIKSTSSEFTEEERQAFLEKMNK
ncbi:replication initiation protein [Staphylococcus xylosus]|uniref:RepB family plasmid replication initiator protein n=3 Tax=Staphylococcus TaxID=1279 RepID=A0A418ICM8_9STAP|nr:MULTISPECIES: RepB family plasmid replication initiator protein [Staphylococcus]MDW8553566.1 RepB family plasmid replication initiator protein [Staphylococcus nepalensis]MDW8553580.1 RepB family plasmid replication initiator protein [Staphylococcus nepalensis]PTG43136.1 replication protein RepB [Staphylococcus cohnii]PTH97663.1 replication protein RepB [Staphylococcus shinii]QRA18132.1 RepB family plasmid replication initiator protein [Staphylococcus shinii]